MDGGNSFYLAGRRYLDCIGNADNFEYNERFMNFVAWSEIFASINCLLGIIASRGKSVNGGLVLEELYSLCINFNNLNDNEKKFLNSFEQYIDIIYNWNNFFKSRGKAIFTCDDDANQAVNLYKVLDSFIGKFESKVV